MDGVSSYHNRCRLCIAEARLSLKLFETEAIRLDLVNKIRSYLSINVSLHDGLPQQICYECLSRIELFHSYKQSCLESQHTLKHWNLFCDGGPAPPDVDVFSGITRSDDIVIDAHSIDKFGSSSSRLMLMPKNKNVLMLTRKKSEPSSPQHLNLDLTPPRKKPQKVDPPPEKNNIGTPKKTTPLSEQVKELSPQKKNKTVAETEAVTRSPEVKLKKVESTVVRCPSPYPGRRPGTPMKEVTRAKSAPRKQSPVSEVLEEASVKLKRHISGEVRALPSPHMGRRSQSSSREKMTQPESASPKRTPEDDSSGKASIDASSSQGPKIVQVLSLAMTPRRRGRPPKRTADAEKEKQTRTSELTVETIAKVFAPSISEMVKRRKRSNSVSSQSYTCPTKQRRGLTKAQSAPSSPTRLLDDPGKTLDDCESVFTDTESTKDLLKSLDSDMEDADYESSCYQSDAESESSRSSTPGPKNPMKAYVRVEKLSGEDKTSLHARSNEDVLEQGIPPFELGRPRGQSNQYRMVKPVFDEVKGKERYKCLRCGSMISHKTYIKEHMKIHTGDKSFVCTVCKKAFRNNYMLKVHMGVHATDRSYTCAVCNHTFVHRDRLRQHMRIHANVPYVCTECGRECSQKQSLLRHMRVHTGERPFECEYCGGKYADRSTWVNHRRIHTGERPFKCKLCNKDFSRLVSLQAHMRSHSDVRPFCCQLCLSRFKTKAHLVKHLSCVHRDLMKSVVNFIKAEVKAE